MSIVAPDAYVAWSGGKDSTALCHLVLAECGVDGHAMSVKDDFDFPGEREYVESLADAWGIGVDILQPDFSLQEWVADNADSLHADEDFHGRASEFSDRAFYSLVKNYREERGSPGVYLGLRGAESDARAGNAARGAVYQKRSGEIVCQPIRNWQDIDVYAYLMSHEIPLLDVYRCVRLHDQPGRVRKSWWLPGAHTRHGATVWIKTYYPSLYRRLTELLPETTTHA